MKRLALLIGLIALLILPAKSLQGQDQSFTEIFGFVPTKAQALREAERIARTGEDWDGPLEQIPDFFAAVEDTPITYSFFFWHDCPRTRIYDFTLMVDNRQIAFEIEGQDMARFRHEFTVETNAPLVREFTFPRQSQGLHNISLVAFAKEGECFQPPPGFTLIPRNSVIAPSRSVLVGLEEPPEFTVARPLSPESFRMGREQQIPNLNPGIYISLSPNPDYAELRFLPSGTSLKVGERFDYFIYVRNSFSTFQQIREWAIVAFVEALQVPIDPFPAHPIWYGSVILPAGYEILLPASLVAPREPGIYGLVLMMFAEPYRLTTEQTLWMFSKATTLRFELRVEEP